VTASPEDNRTGAVFAGAYDALHTKAGLVDRSDRGRIVVTGSDRRTFLQGLLTNDILALGPGTGCYAALLAPNGRMIADMRVLERGDRILLDVSAAQAASLATRFDQLLFSEDVQVADGTAAGTTIGIYGPSAAAVVAGVFQADGGGPLDPAALDAMPLNANIAIDGTAGPAVIVRSDDAGVDGFDLLVDAERADAIAERLRGAGAVDADAEAVDVSRIEAGRPVFGIDMDEETIPLEAGIEDRAISLTKGCYVGQEIIIRVLHRAHGRVAKRLAGIVLDPGAHVPSRGAVIRSGERQVGAVTSAAFSPALGRPVAMGYVHRDFAAASTPVTVESGGVTQPAVVASLPFVDRGSRSGS
jgi:folate-binding protein YgfZ